MKLTTLTILFLLSAPAWAQNQQDQDFDEWFSRGGSVQVAALEDALLQASDGQPVQLSPHERMRAVESRLSNVESMLARVKDRIDALKVPVVGRQPYQPAPTREIRWIEPSQPTRFGGTPEPTQAEKDAKQRAMDRAPRGD